MTNYERDRNLRHNRRIGYPKFDGPLISQIDTVPHYAYPEMPRNTTEKLLPASLRPPEIPGTIKITNEGLTLHLLLPELMDRAESFHLQQATDAYGPWATIKRDCGGSNFLVLPANGVLTLYFRVLAIGQHGFTPSDVTTSDGLVILTETFEDNTASVYQAEETETTAADVKINKDFKKETPPAPPPLTFPRYSPK